MQSSIKHQNTLTTITAANAKELLLAIVVIVNGYSSQTQVYRGA